MLDTLRATMAARLERARRLERDRPAAPASKKKTEAAEEDGGVKARAHSEATKAKIRAGVKRTIGIRRARRTRAEIAADPLDLKRVDFTREPGLANGRTRVRDLRSARASPGESGINFLSCCGFVPMSKLAEHERTCPSMALGNRTRPRAAAGF